MRRLLFHDRVTQGAKMPGAGRKKTAPGEGMIQLLRGNQMLCMAFLPAT